MITNDAELEVVRKQLARAEDALDSLRRDVRSKNEKMYNLMAESYIEMLQTLRSDIDVYLGIATLPANAALAISLEGSQVMLGHVSAGLITRTIDTFRRGLQSVVEVIESSKKAALSRRRERWIERICDLPLVGVAPGSVRVLLGQPEAGTLFSEEEQRALHGAIKVLFDGLEWAQSDDSRKAPLSFEQLPLSTRQSILTVITRLLPPRSGPVERIAFQSGSEALAGLPRRATLTRRARDRVRDELTRLAADRQYIEVEGVIRSVDLDSQTFALRERPNNLPDLPCEYRLEIEDAVKECLDCRVMVSGTLETSRMTRKETMEAESIELVASEEETGDMRP